MDPDRSPRALPRLLIWLLCLAGLAALAAQRLEMSYDLGLFLPAPRTAAQELLVERLGDSPGSRYVMIAVPDDAARVTGLARRLQNAPEIEAVLSDLLPPPERPPEPLFGHRFLLADMDWSAEGLGAALDERLADLGLGSSPEFEQLITRDPVLLSVAIMESLYAGSASPWLTASGERVLIAVTAAPAFDIDAQARALQTIESAVADSFGQLDAARISGAGVFGVGLRSTIESEAFWRSLWASAALITVLLLLYRSLYVLLLAALPLAAGLVCGVAAVSVVFGGVHGITLAFGFTLLGVAIDYPLHYLSQARREAPAQALRSTWPTLSLSALSTMLAYGALMVGGARGMAQLGLFSAAGVAGALLTTGWLLPSLSRRRLAPGSGNPAPAFIEAAAPAPVLRAGVIGALFLAALALAWAGGDRPWWSSSLAALSPIPQAQLDEERELRQATGAPSIRYLVAVQDPGLQSLLAGAAQTRLALQGAVDAGLLGGFAGITPLLPTEAAQRRRQAAIPEAETLAANLARAVAASPFTRSAFDPFLADANRTRALDPLTPASYAGSDLEALLQSQLYQAADGDWTALFTLQGAADPEALAGFLTAQQPGAMLVDLRSASESLVSDYRKRTLAVLGVVFLVLTAGLSWRLQPRRALWTVLLVLGSVLVTAAGLRVFSGSLDLYQLAGLLLVTGIGLDYALFLGKRDRGGAQHAVFACMASTVAAFGVLAASSIPALHSLGSTVALGSAVCFSAAWLGSRPRRS